MVWPHATHQIAHARRSKRHIVWSWNLEIYSSTECIRKERRWRWECPAHRYLLYTLFLSLFGFGRDSTPKKKIECERRNKNNPMHTMDTFNWGACNKITITYVEIHIFFTKYSISVRSAVRLKLKWIKRNKLWMPMKTVQPHSVNVSISPHADIRKDDCAKHVSAISTIRKWDQPKYRRPRSVGASVCCSGQAPLNFNITHCDGNENVSSWSFGNGLNMT